MRDFIRKVINYFKIVIIIIIRYVWRSNVVEIIFRGIFILVR